MVVESISEIIYNKKCSRRFGRNRRPSGGSERENFTQKHRYKQDTN